MSELMCDWCLGLYEGDYEMNRLFYQSLSRIKKRVEKKIHPRSSLFTVEVNHHKKKLMKQFNDKRDKMIAENQKKMKQIPYKSKSGTDLIFCSKKCLDAYKDSCSHLMWEDEIEDNGCIPLD
jgi:hypothetical protein